MNIKKCSSFVSHIYRHHRNVMVAHFQRGNPSIEEESSENSSSLVQVCQSWHESFPDSLTPVHQPLDHTVHHLLGIEKLEQKNRKVLSLYCI